jgi:hypothetical protein
MGTIRDLSYPLLLIATQLFLPSIYILLLSSNIFTIKLISRPTASILVALVLFAHVYTAIIGYMVHNAVKRRKKYAQSLHCDDAIHQGITENGYLCYEDEVDENSERLLIKRGQGGGWVN